MSTRFAETVMQDFAKRLKEARKAAGYAHAKDFAEALGVEPPTYRYWERGQALPDLVMVCRVCRLLDVSLDYLLPHARKRPTSSTSDGGLSAA